MKTFASALLLSLLMIGSLAAADLPRAAGAMQITTLEGKTLDFNEWKGKPVLVMYFSTDCPHCQSAAQIMGPLYAEYRAKGVEFVGVTLNPTAKDNLAGFVQKYGVKFPTGLGDRAHFARFAALPLMTRFYYPYLLFVDKDGNIQEEHEGAERGYFADLGAGLRVSLDRLLVGS